MGENTQREKLGSRLGFILLSAGCAIGVGNVWKFPYMAGQYGGGLFVLIYLICLVVLGVPILTMEFAVGRAGQKSPAKMFRALEPKGTKWHAHGYASLVGNTLLMMFYTTVAGWMLIYFFKMAKGDFAGLDSATVSSQFGKMLSNPWQQILFMGIVTLLGFLVCGFGVKKGVERSTKWMMIALLVIMVVLAINGFFLVGAGEGLQFYLVPDFNALGEKNLFVVLGGAMTQAFFTLSLGIGSMAIFGSYIGKDRSLLGEAVNVTVLDTFVAVTAGLIIFPACFTYDIEVSSGPGLIFQALPNVFNNMPGGRIWGSLFFIFMSFAALSTVFAVFENIIACLEDMTGLKRWKICVIAGVGLFVLSIPCILGFNAWSGVNILGLDIQSIEDFIVSNLLLPIGSLIFVLFCTLKRGWGYDNFVAEANEGKGLKIKSWMRIYIKYILPVIMVIFIIISLLMFCIDKGFIVI